MRRALALPIALLICGCTLEPLIFPGGTTGSGSGGGGGGGGAPECVAHTDCADNNPCSTDACDAGVCSNNPAAQGAACADGDLCNGDEACDGEGVCVSAAPAVVDDGDSCTADACDPATGVSHDKAPNCLDWKATPDADAPLARQRHTAVWTGSKMIVWGGSVTGAVDVTATGAVFDPVSRTWTPTSMTGAPSPRHSHSAVWTGSQMIVWGGFGVAALETSGAVYDPEADTWAPMTNTGAPSGRVQHIEVWTGSEMVVWGGFSNVALGSGGRYDPKTDKWLALGGPAGASPRYGHSAVWTGDRMIMWGGANTFDWLLDGAFYAAGAWTGATSTTGAPEIREGHTAIWTGSKMVVWGGWNGGPFVNSGGVFDPSSGAKGSWTATSLSGAPSERDEQSATWTGSKMLIWGGCGADACKDQYGNGGLWTPGAGGGTWSTVAEHPALSARRGHTALWTGSEVIIWGGRVGTKPTNTGAQAVVP